MVHCEPALEKKRNKQSCNPIFSLLIHTDFQFFAEIYIAVPNKLRAYTWECQGQLLTLGKVRRARYDIKRTPARRQKASILSKERKLKKPLIGLSQGLPHS